jgi:iron complex transport system ATP-binding protein
MSLISMEHIDFSYKSTNVFTDLSLEIFPGTFVGVTGPNGAGKSTLIRIISGFLKTQKGNIFINGKAISSYNLRTMARQMAYVAQSSNYYTHSTVFNTILLGRKPYFNWKPGKEDYRITAEIIEMLDLQDVSDRKTDELSGGQFQRVIIGRAMAQDTGIILLDEPTSNLDIRHQLELMHILKKQSQEGKCIIMAIHDLNMASRYCDRILMINEGKLFADGGKEIINAENIEKLYGISAHFINFEENRFIIAKDVLWKK